jgi:3-phosphoshikimate 1-carboxyvinyltransferase
MSSIEITPVPHPLHGTLRPPGSKSITNRAFVLAALASGPTLLTGVLDSQDTRVMVESLRRLGFSVDPGYPRLPLHRHSAGRPTFRNDTADLWLENSGTSIRFLTVCVRTRTRSLSPRRC